ncbi:metallophosphoesterase family protein [Kribbella sp. WER1]
MRIAQLTDLHVRAHLPGTSVLGRRRSREALGLTSKALDDARRRGAEVVVVTGDLVDVPSFLLTGERYDAFDRDRWLSAAAADYRLLRDLLDGSGLPYIVVPGNHDSYPMTGSVFGTGPLVREIGELRFVSFWDREDHANIPHRRRAERALFDDLLTSTGPDQVHLQHFVVTPELNDDWPHTYQDGRELRGRIVESGRVRLSLSGHYHPGTDLIHDGGSTFATGSALAEAPHCYRLYDVGASDAPVRMQIVPLLEDGPLRPAAFVNLAQCFGALPVRWEDLFPLQPAADAVLRDPSTDRLLVGLVDQGWFDTAGSVPHLLDAVLDKCAELLAVHGLSLDAVYAGSAEQEAAAELRLDLSRSYSLDGA